MAYLCRAARCRTMQLKEAAWVALHLDLATGEDTVTDRTNALIVERIPFPFPVHPAQNIQTFLRRESLGHLAIKACSLPARNRNGVQLKTRKKT